MNNLRDELLKQDFGSLSSTEKSIVDSLFIIAERFDNINLQSDRICNPNADTVEGAGETCKATDTQVGGDHYKSLAIQPVEFIHANNLGFLEGNIIKYACRHRKKGGKADLEKIIHYAQLLIQLEYES